LAGTVAGRLCDPRFGRRFGTMFPEEETMTKPRTILGFVCLLAAALAPATPARADINDIGQTLFRGIAFVSNPLYLSNPQNGPFFNENIYFQRLEQNRAGGGYTYENFRFFGQDSFGNLNTLDLSPIKFQLGRDSQLTGSAQPVGLHTKVGYTTRFIPEVFFQSETVQRAVNVLGGTSAAAPAPITYNITVNTGVQDFTVNGDILMSSAGRMNALGFYDLQMRITNNGTYNADGVFLTDEQNLDFDVGPINVSGNLAMDALAAVIHQTGNVLGAVPPRVASGAAQKEITLDEVIAKMEAGEQLTQEETQILVRESLMSAVLTDPLGTLVNGLPSGETSVEGLTVTFSPSDSAPPPAVANAGSVAPEPGTLLLVAIATGVGSYVVRRRRHRGE